MSPSSSEPRLDVTTDDGVVEITMGYSPVNAFSHAFLDKILEAVRAVPADTGAVIIASSVDGIFAAGGDIPFMANGALEDQLAYVRLCQETYSSFEELACPAIAAIDGACLGGGVELSLGCDLRVATESRAPVRRRGHPGYRGHQAPHRGRARPPASGGPGARAGGVEVGSPVTARPGGAGGVCPAAPPGLSQATRLSFAAPRR